MTKTHHITHSNLFLRSFEGMRRDPDRAAAEGLLDRQQVSHDAFLAMFDSIDDFDVLVRDCIPTLEELEPVARRERAPAERGASLRGKSGSRARTTSRTGTAGAAPASRRR